MKILHLLDHSIPLQSVYTFRTLAILQEQRRLGWETYHLTSSKQQGAVADEEDCEGFHFYRTRERRFGFHKVPALRQWGVAAFPLIFSNQPIGALKLLSKQKNFFSEEKKILIQSFANLAAVAIQNAWLFDEVRMTNRQLHALSQRLMKVQENERLQLSRELHDESGQLLAALTVQLGLVERDVEKPETLRERTTGLKNTARMIQENLHRLAVHLRPASLDHLGLVTALQQYIQEFSRQYNIDVDFETVGMRDERLPIGNETTATRCWRHRRIRRSTATSSYASPVTARISSN